MAQRKIVFYGRAWTVFQSTPPAFSVELNGVEAFRGTPLTYTVGEFKSIADMKADNEIDESSGLYIGDKLVELTVEDTLVGDVDLKIAMVSGTCEFGEVGFTHTTIEELDFDNKSADFDPIIAAKKPGDLVTEAEFAYIKSHVGRKNTPTGENVGFLDGIDARIGVKVNNIYVIHPETAPQGFSIFPGDELTATLTVPAYVA